MIFTIRPCMRLMHSTVRLDQDPCQYSAVQFKGVDITPTENLHYADYGSGTWIIASGTGRTGMLRVGRTPAR